jgi:hypothetical protein
VPQIEQFRLQLLSTFFHGVSPACSLVVSSVLALKLTNSSPQIFDNLVQSVILVHNSTDILLDLVSLLMLLL